MDKRSIEDAIQMTLVIAAFCALFAGAWVMTP